ncbi:FAD/NAD(P)-binding protein [Streptomyces sp. NPDC102274]|uniref:FAD/NAD(P)-binding protein n=1 Tax=Streptomyces sp. NPDC102274 TaxID=3366151 RepID=UPI00380C370B
MGVDPGSRGTPSIALIGAGPRGTSILERIVASAAECAPGLDLAVHVIDPFPPGGGYVWRGGQSGLLWSNTRSDECTLFTDESVKCEGPLVPGPSLAEWAEALVRGECALPEGFKPGAGTSDEASRVHAGWFATRQLVGEYLSWVFWSTVDTGAPQVGVRVHQARVADVRELPTGRQRLSLDGAGALDVDVVIHAQGNFQVGPLTEETSLARRASAHRLTYAPTASTAEVSLDSVLPGEAVLLRGLGLAFFDTMVLLTEGRGGRFCRDASGDLRYEPSGREPVLHAGSRRGVPYRSKFHYTLSRPLSGLPRYFTPEELGKGPLDFASGLWPLIARELTAAGYRELAASHPERLGVEADAFLARLDTVEWNSPEMKELIESAVPEEGDRIDVEGMDRPLTGRGFHSPAALQEWMTAYLAADVERGRDPRHSAHLAVYHAIFSVADALWRVVQSGLLSPASAGPGLPEFFQFCRFRTSGPPGPRLEQLLALARAGVVHFIGAETEVTLVDGVFAARSSSTDTEIRARALIEARLPGRALSRATDPLLLRLLERGEVREQTQVDPATGGRHPTGLVDTVGQRLRGSDGAPHPRRFFAYPGDFPRPGTNSVFLHQSDALARSALRELVRAVGEARL